VSAATANVVGVLFALDDLPGLAPSEVVRVQQGVDEDNDVHERRGEEVEKVSDKVLGALEVVAREPEADAEGVEL
jgi:hypothetical protein